MVARSVRTSLVCLGVVLSGFLPRPLHAEKAPDEFPPGIGGLWWGESMKSAQKKCATWKPTPDKASHGKLVYVRCLMGQVQLDLIFRWSKLTNVGFKIDPPGYDECAKSVLAAIGLKGRIEDKDGNEAWGITYTDARGAPTGWMMCSHLDDGLEMDFGTP